MEVGARSLLFRRFVTSSGTIHDVGVVDFDAVDDIYIDKDGECLRIDKETAKCLVSTTPVKSFTIAGFKRVSLDLPEPNQLW